jgi:hypothetical protein
VRLLICPHKFLWYIYGFCLLSFIK